MVAAMPDPPRPMTAGPGSTGSVLHRQLEVSDTAVFGAPRGVLRAASWLSTAGLAYFSVKAGRFNGDGVCDADLAVTKSSTRASPCCNPGVQEDGRSRLAQHLG